MYSQCTPQTPLECFLLTGSGGMNTGLDRVSRVNNYWFIEGGALCTEDIHVSQTAKSEQITFLKRQVAFVIAHELVDLVPFTQKICECSMRSNHSKPLP